MFTFPSKTIPPNEITKFSKKEFPSFSVHRSFLKSLANISHFFVSIPNIIYFSLFSRLSCLCWKESFLLLLCLFLLSRERSYTFILAKLHSIKGSKQFYCLEMYISIVKENRTMKSFYALNALKERETVVVDVILLELYTLNI